MSTIFLNIADFRIKIETQSGYQTTFETGWAPYVCPNQKDTEDVSINAIAGIPKEMLDEANPIFEAYNENLNFYKVYRFGDALKFIIFDQDNNAVIQQVAICSQNFAQWDVYSEPLPNSTLIPLKYPLGPLLMYYLTVHFDAIMIHASGVFDGSTGRIFTGFSGAGKSTISRLWANANNLLVNDDRLIICKQPNGYFMYNTPMYYNDEPKTTPIHSIYLISHSPENVITRLKGAMAITKVLAHCIQNNYDKSYINHHLSFLSQLCSHIKIYELGFVPNQSVITFVKQADI